MSTMRRRWPTGKPLNRSIWARISSSWGFASASAIPWQGPIRPPKTQKGPWRAFVRARAAFSSGADLEHEQERDQERVDAERLDQRETENHRAADLTGRAGVARDAV